MWRHCGEAAVRSAAALGVTELGWIGKLPVEVLATICHFRFSSLTCSCGNLHAGRHQGGHCVPDVSDRQQCSFKCSRLTGVIPRGSPEASRSGVTRALFAEQQIETLPGDLKSWCMAGAKSPDESVEPFARLALRSTVRCDCIRHVGATARMAAACTP
jgi:hypothetical protein